MIRPNDDDSEMSDESPEVPGFPGLPDSEGPDYYTVKLPFPTEPLDCGNRVVEEYVIPDDQRQWVLEALFLGEPVPSLDDVLYDLHEGKTFIVRQYRVTWEDGRNWLLSPYYPSSGGSVIDWMPADWADEEGDGDDGCDLDQLDEMDDEFDEDNPGDGPPAPRIPPPGEDDGTTHPTGEIPF
jgi:hypothetical protein